MKKLVAEFPHTSRYYDEGKRDIWGNKVLTRYILDEDKEIDDGYMYKRSKREIDKLKEKYGKNVGIQEYTICPEEYVVHG